MPTFWCSDDKHTWQKIDDDIDLESFAYQKLLSQQGLDSDGGYYAWFEFWRNGVRTYALATYDGWDNYCQLYGEMNDFTYGEWEEIRKAYRGDRITANKLDPTRDYILI